MQRERERETGRVRQTETEIDSVFFYYRRLRHLPLGSLSARHEFGSWMGRSLNKETVLSTWVERYVGLTVRQSQKWKTFRVWLRRWRGCSVNKR